MSPRQYACLVIFISLSLFPFMRSAIGRDRYVKADAGLTSFGTETPWSALPQKSGAALGRGQYRPR